MSDLTIEVIGWVSNTLFAAAAVPQAWHSYKQGHSHGLTWGLLLMWFFGELGAIVFAFAKDIPIQLTVNYFFNFIMLLIIIRYKIWERKPDEGLQGDR